jgi:CRP-like cAMP-binding protein
MKRRTYCAGDVIFSEGAPSDAAYLVVSGTVEILAGFGSPQPRSIAVLGKGKYFGEMGAIDNHPRSATAVARGDVECMSVNREEFMDLLLSRPQEAIDLLKILFERLREANRKMA